MKTRIFREGHLFSFSTKKTIVAVVILLRFSFCCAQEQVSPTHAQWVGVEKEMIKSAPYIFEGTVTTEKLYNEKKQVVSTCIMQITKIYRGSPQLKLGSIKIITGQRDKNMNGYDNPSFGGREGMNINKGGTYILFCTLANSSWLVDSTITDNTITLTRIDCCNYPIVLTGKDVATWRYSSYSPVDSLYSFFKENGLTVQEQVETNK